MPSLHTVSRNLMIKVTFASRFWPTPNSSDQTSPSPVSRKLVAKETAIDGSRANCSSNPDDTAISRRG